MTEETWTAVDTALAELLLRPDERSVAALRASENAGLPPIAVSPNLGKLLTLLVQMCGAQRVLEIGTLGGYSTIFLARGIHAGGALVSLELREEHAAVARSNVADAGLSAIVEIRVGPAAESLAQMAADEVEPFDFVFIDADKEGYPDYLKGALALSRPGTVIVADNIVRDGAVFDADQDNNMLSGIRTFLANVAAEPRLSAVGLQLVGSKGYDGILIARVET